MTKYINPKNGETVETAMTVQEARAALVNSTSQFAQDMRAKLNPSPAQLFWLMKLAVEATTPQAPKAPTATYDCASIFAMFTKAAESLKHPAIHIADTEGHEVKMTLAKPESKNAGFIYVKVGADYAGKISPQGQFYAVSTCPQTLPAFLAKFAARPEEMAALHGKTTGCCCFCNRTLTTEESKAVGYGPVCAEKFGLAWGHIANATFTADTEA